MKKILFLFIFLFCFFIIACKEEQEDNELNSRSIDNGISSENEQDIENNNQDKENEHNEKSQEDNSDDNSNEDYKLSLYKEKAKEEIATYCESLDINNYFEDNWSEIKSIYNSSKDLIDNQSNIEDIDVTKNIILYKIMSVCTKTLIYDYILENFDLEDEKLYWEETADDVFHDDKIIVVLKRPINFIELNVEWFGLENAISIEYLGGVTPPDYFFEPEYSGLLASYRQIVLIRLESFGKEKLIESIRWLEKLEFVKYASPDMAIKPT